MPVIKGLVCFHDRIALYDEQIEFLHI